MGLSGLEPPTSRLSGARSNQLSYKPWLYLVHPLTMTAVLYRMAIIVFGRSLRILLPFDTSLCQWRLRDSNSRPPACKAGALPTELSPHDASRHPGLYTGL